MNGRIREVLRGFFFISFGFFFYFAIIQLRRKGRVLSVYERRDGDGNERVYA